MATITDRATVDKIIEGNGIYPGDEDMPIVKIVEYNNMFNGGVAWGLVYKGDPLFQYEESPACLNTKVIWQKQKEPTRPTMEVIEQWIMDGVAEATDGCDVEPDGTCPHGKRSWLIHMGLI